MAEEERQPMTRDAVQTVQPDLQQHQRHVPDTSYPRSVEGILRIVAAVKLARARIYTMVLPIRQKILYYHSLSH